MADIFKHLFDFIFVKTKRNSIRLVQLLIIALATLLINDYFGITKNIRTNQKLAQLDKLKTLDPTGFQRDSLINDEIRLIKNSILDKSNFLEKSKLLISTQLKSMLNWRSLSASFSLLLAMLVIPFFVFSDKTLSLSWQFLALLIVEMVFLALSIVFIKLLGLIPDFKYAWINHVINWLVQIMILIPFSLKASKK